MAKKINEKNMKSEMKSMRPMFETEMFIYESKANLNENILFGKITHHLDSLMRQMLLRGMFGNEGYYIPF